MKKILIIIGVLILIGFSYYALSPFFNTKNVPDEILAPTHTTETDTTVRESASYRLEDNISIPSESVPNK